MTEFWKRTTNSIRSNRSTLHRIARESSINTKRLARALESSKHKQLVNADIELARHLGIEKSPTFVINGHLVDADASYAVFKKAINQALRGEHR